MKNKSFIYYYQLLLCLVVYLQIVSPKISSISIILLVLFSFIGFFRNKLEFKFNFSITILALFYLAYLIGTYFTSNSNLDLANHYLESKLSFLIFPIIFSFKSEFKLKFNFLFIATILGVFHASLIGILSAIKCSMTSGFTFSCFSSSNISSIHHPSYFSVFILCGILMMWLGFYLKWKWFLLKWIIPLSIYFLFFYFLCQSLAGLLFLIAIVFGFFIFQIERKIGRNKVIIIAILFPFIVFICLSKLPIYKVDFNSTVDSFTVFIKNPKKFVESKTLYKTGNEERMVLWSITVSLIKQYPFGVGTGNVDDFLIVELLKFKQSSLAFKKYNPHNQFLQTTLEIGFIGLLILLIFIVISFKTAFKNKDWLLVMILSTLVFNSLFESMLQRQSGIVFYSFWICLLLIYPFNLNSSKEVEARGK